MFGSNFFNQLVKVLLFLQLDWQHILGQNTCNCISIFHPLFALPIMWSATTQFRHLFLLLEWTSPADCIFTWLAFISWLYSIGCLSFSTNGLHFSQSTVLFWRSDLLLQNHLYTIEIASFLGTKSCWHATLKNLKLKAKWENTFSLLK